MKSFFSTVLAVLTALIASVLFLFGLLVVASVTSESPVPKVAENTLLRIKLSGSLEERAIEDPLNGLNAALLGMDAPEALGLNELREGLAYAAEDDRIQGILLDQGAFGAGYGLLGRADRSFECIQSRATENPFTHTANTTRKKEQHSVHWPTLPSCTRAASFELRGIGTTSTYYKTFFDKFGIEPLVVRGTGNKFKSAVEPFIASEMSDENRLQLTHLITQFWDFIGLNFEAERGAIGQRWTTPRSALLVWMQMRPWRLDWWMR